MKRASVTINSSLRGSMAEISIRKAHEGDRAAVEALLDTSWRTHWAPHVEPQSVQRFDRERPVIGYVETYIAQLVVAERDGVIAGMYHLEGEMLHAIHAHVLFIGSGVGAALMDHAENAGARRLEVRAFNSRARAFYEKRGWRAIAEIADSEMGTPVRTIVMERD